MRESSQPSCSEATRVSFANPARGDLVESRAGVNVRAGGVLRLRAGQEAAGRLGVASALGFHRGFVRKPGEQRDVLAIRFERLQDAGELEGGAGLGRLPLVHHDAVRHVDHRDARRCYSRAVGPASAGHMASRKGSATAEPSPRSIVRRETCLRVRKFIVALLLCELATFCGCAAGPRI